MDKRLWRKHETNMLRMYSCLNSKCSEVYDIKENMTNINSLLKFVLQQHDYSTIEGFLPHLHLSFISLTISTRGINLPVSELGWAACYSDGLG